MPQRQVHCMSLLALDSAQTHGTCFQSPVQLLHVGHRGVRSLAAVWAFLFALVLFSAETSAYTLLLQTTSDEVTIGETITVDVMLDTTRVSGESVVLADAVVDYETEMLQLTSVDADTAADSDFYYGYTLSVNSFPITDSYDSGSVGRIQLVAGVPAFQALAANQGAVRVGRLQFVVKEPAASRSDWSTTVQPAFNDGRSAAESKVIADDGSGTNLLTAATGLTLTVAPISENVPLPWWPVGLLALLFALIAGYRRPPSRMRGAQCSGSHQ